MRKMALKKKNYMCFITYNCNYSNAKKCMKNLTKSAKILLSDGTYINILFLLKAKNGHILTFSEKMQISVIFLFATYHLHSLDHPALL